MMMRRPAFLDSEYFYYDNKGTTLRERWCLRDDTPDDVRLEYEEYVALYEEWLCQWEREILIEELPLILRSKDEKGVSDD